MTLTLFGYTPPARFDYVAWVSARIEQSATSGGSYTAVETIPLVPGDIDPRFPRPRAFTTEAATDGDFYRIVWVGADASESEPTQPVQFIDVDGVQPFATRTELAALLKVDATTNAAVLDRILLVSAGEIIHEIGVNTPLDAYGLALVTQVNIERAAEHWAQLKSPFGFVGLGGLEHSPQVVVARDSWDRHAHKLAAVKLSWGIA